MIKNINEFKFPYVKMKTIKLEKIKVRLFTLQKVNYSDTRVTIKDMGKYMCKEKIGVTTLKLDAGGARYIILY